MGYGLPQAIKDHAHCWGIPCPALNIMQPMPAGYHPKKQSEKKRIPAS